LLLDLAESEDTLLKFWVYSYKQKLYQSLWGENLYGNEIFIPGQNS